MGVVFPPIHQNQDFWFSINFLNRKINIIVPTQRPCSKSYFWQEVSLQLYNFPCEKIKLGAPVGCIRWVSLTLPRLLAFTALSLAPGRILMKLG